MFILLLLQTLYYLGLQRMYTDLFVAETCLHVANKNTAIKLQVHVALLTVLACQAQIGIPRLRFDKPSLSGPGHTKGLYRMGSQQTQTPLRDPWFNGN